MELYPHDGELLVYHPLNRTVIEIYMTYLHTCGECIRVYCKTMVLSRDIDTARSQVPYGMVSSMMPELELICLRSKSPGKKLMAQGKSPSPAACQPGRLPCPRHNPDERGLLARVKTPYRLAP